MFRRGLIEVLSILRFLMVKPIHVSQTVLLIKVSDLLGISSDWPVKGQ